VLFLLAHIISAVAPHQLAATEQLPPSTLIVNAVFLPLAAYVIASQTLADPKSVRVFLWFLVGLGFYLAVICILQRLGLESLVFPRQIVDESLGVNPERARGPLLNSAADGVIMVAALAAALFMGQQRGIRFRRFALLTAALLPIGIFATQTRAIYLGAAVVVIGGAMFARGYRRWYVLLLGAAAAVIAVNFRTFLSADRTQGGVTSAGEVESRLNDWATAWWALEEKPAFGWGIARFPEVNTVYHQAWPGVDWQLGWGYLSHNTHLAFAAELGMVGLLLWVGIIVAVAARTRRAWLRLPEEGMISRGLVLAFWLSGIAWLLNMAVIDMRLFVAINTVIFVWAGMIAGLADREREELIAMNAAVTPKREPVGVPSELVRAPEPVAVRT
jgi:O-antigen ligase